MNLNGRFGVIGNPIKHSLSPQIHQQFAAQFNASIDYHQYLVETDELKNFIREFFQRQGLGLNVTLPFKQSVSECVDKLSEEARLAGSVNTLSLHGDQIIGTTTDGQGLLYDLNRLGWRVKDRTILVVGAGGASQSILVSLLHAGAKVKIFNRTAAKAESLVEKFSTLGVIELYQPGNAFDGLISSTSEFNLPLMSPLAEQINQRVFCYDLNYGERAQGFKDFARHNGCRQISDGLGMLVGQAAKSFEIWTGKLPQIEPITIAAS